VKGPRPNR